MRELMIPTPPNPSQRLEEGWATLAEFYEYVDEFHEVVEASLAMDDPDAEDRAVRELWG